MTLPGDDSREAELKRLEVDYAAMEKEYREKLAHDRDPETLANYALFLQTVRDDAVGAEKLYREALAVEDENPELLRLMADFIGKQNTGQEEAEALFTKALSIAPNHPDLLIRYAFFRRRSGQDLAVIDAHYEVIVAQAPDDPALLVEYASYLKAFRGDQDKAEALFERALSALPKAKAEIAEQYISLLDVSAQEKGDKGPEALYLRALEKDPDNITVRMRYAAYLWLHGRGQEARPHLDDAIAMCDDDNVLLCLLFYLYAHEDHRAEEGVPPESLHHIRRLIDKGCRKADFDPDANIMRAITDGHPEPQLLKILPNVICGDVAPKKLGRFPAWPIGPKKK